MLHLCVNVGLQNSHETAKDGIEGSQGAAEGRRRKLAEMQEKLFQALGNPPYWWSPGGPTVESSHRVRVQWGLMAESSCSDRMRDCEVHSGKVWNRTQVSRQADR